MRIDVIKRIVKQKLWLNDSLSETYIEAAADTLLTPNNQSISHYQKSPNKSLFTRDPTTICKGKHPIKFSHFYTFEK